MLILTFYVITLTVKILTFYLNFNFSHDFDGHNFNILGHNYNSPKHDFFSCGGGGNGLSYLTGIIYIYMHLMGYPVLHV